MVSKHYYRALAEATKHHEDNKTYSGKFLRPHAKTIKEIIDRLEVRTLLDYGCGKGIQYKWVAQEKDQHVPAGMTIEGFWGLKVRKYDPCYAPFAETPLGKGGFDMVICTHVLGSVPVVDLQHVVDELTFYGRKVVYIAEKIGPVRKQVFSEPELMPRWTAQQWAQNLNVMLAITRAWRNEVLPEVWLATREKDVDGGVQTKLQRVDIYESDKNPGRE